MRDLQEAFDAAELVVRSAAEFVPAELRRKSLERLTDLRTRNSRTHSSLMLALVGGTGGGKSSLLNAVAHTEVAGVGRTRPYTERPLAWIPEDRDPALAAALDDLGIVERRMHRDIDGIALLDLPDMDSVALDHRAVVEHLIPRVDGLIWVLDPEKYHDPGLRDDFLAPLSGYAEQTIFILNKIDRLAAADQGPVVEDVKRMLGELGYGDSPLLALAAAPDAGPPLGVVALTDYLSMQLNRKRTAHGKLVADLAGIIKETAREAGVWDGGGIRLSARWPITREAALSALRPSSPSPSEDALCRIEDLVAAGAAEVGGPIGDRIRDQLDHTAILEALTKAQQSVARDDVAEARSLLDSAVGMPMREMLWHRAYFAALATYAHVGVRQVASRYGVTVA